MRRVEIIQINTIECKFI